MTGNDTFNIRESSPADEPFLWEMLFQSLHVRPGGQSFDRTIIETPELARYVEGWGRRNDLGFIAENADGNPIGAAWARLFTEDAKGYGFVDGNTPELAMAILPDFRGRGIGTILLNRLLKSLEKRYPSVSLSVDSTNAALRLYERTGFKEVSSNNGFLLMRRDS